MLYLKKKSTNDFVGLIFFLLIIICIVGCGVSKQQIRVSSYKKPADKTAAHKTLPFGTYVKVKNLSNLREAIVRINDRGPFVKGRIIDLSYSAARGIGLVGPGVARVRVVALSKEVGKIKSGNKYKPLVEAKDFKKGEFTIQVGAFEDEDNARRLADRLRVIFDHVTITTYVPYEGGTFYRVRVSLSEDLTEASQIVKKLEYLGFSENFIVAL
jgi:rare lipoprotein A